MIQNNMVVLKLGGSVITNKRKAYSFARQNTMRTAEEIRKSGQFPIVIVHGTGSFGSSVLQKHNLISDSDEFLRWEQMDVVVAFNHRVRELNLRIMDTFIHSGLKVVSIAPSSLFVCANGIITNCSLEILEDYVKREIIPVTHGDVIIDKEHGFYACSSDQMVVEISRYFQPERVLFVTDVDGIYSPGLLRNSEVTIIHQVDKRVYSGLTQNKESLVTEDGEMLGKLRRAMATAEFCDECLIVNGSKPGVLRKALIGDKVLGTRVIADNGVEMIT